MSRRLSILAALLALCATAHGGHLWLSVMDAAESNDDLDSIDGCIAYWSVLDSSDYVLNGIAVTNLTDKSGNGRTATLIGANATIAAGAINGRDAINFANNSSFSFTTIPISNFTVVAVFQRPAANSSTITLGSDGNAAFPWWYTDAKFYLQYGGGYRYSGAVSTTGNFWCVSSAGTNYVSGTLYINGTNVALPSTATGNYDFNLNRIGKCGTAYTIGRGGCYAIYNRILSESDRATVDAIIKAKWGF